MAIDRLTRAGLADPVTWCRTPDELSEGQAARLELADLTGHSRRRIVIDEWLAKLDRITARSVAWSFGQVLRRQQCQALLITANDDIAEDLNPDFHVKIDWSGAPSIEAPERNAARCTVLDELTYDHGTYADWAALKHLHYASGDPSTRHSIHVLRHPQLTYPAAVGILAWPDLHSQARNVATGNRYQVQSNPHAAKLLNQEVRRLARIVVAPDLRCSGVARRLITEIATRVPMRWLECSTQMGRFNRFLASAGMSMIDQASAPAEAILQDLAVQYSAPAHATLDPQTLEEWADGLSIRKRREWRRACWHTYHHFKLHRRTRGRIPKVVPGPADPRWADAFALAAARLIGRPTYWIMEIDHTRATCATVPPDSHTSGTTETRVPRMLGSTAGAADSAAPGSGSHHPP